MDLNEIFEVISTLDTNLKYYIEKYDIWIYIILFSIVYAKTGFVVLTFLPGDTLVFASATLAAVSSLNIWFLIPGFFIATIIGDNQNFAIGKMVGAISAERSFIQKYLPKKILDRAEQFLEKYGVTAITFSRFIPLMRTMMPFISGYTKYSHHNFVICNFTGALLWTVLWLGTGFILGSITWVEDNLFLALLLITVLAIIPSIAGFAMQRTKGQVQ